MIIGGILGAALGAVVAAYIDSTRVFVCNDQNNLEAACASGHPILILMASGTTIGLIIGVVVAHMVSRARQRGST
jgi:uncharacterized membrane protein YfcA